MEKACTGMTMYADEQNCDFVSKLVLHYVANGNKNFIHMHCAHKHHTSITNHGTTNHLVNKNRCVVVRIGYMCWLTIHNSHCTYVQTQSYNCTTKKIWIHFIEVLVFLCLLRSLWIVRNHLLLLFVCRIKRQNFTENFKAVDFASTLIDETNS